MKPTPAQLRALSAVAAVTTPDDPVDGWAEVFTHYDSKRGTPPEFEMRNFDRITDACERRGWISVEKDEQGTWINLTPAGRAILDAAKE